MPGYCSSTYNYVCDVTTPHHHHHHQLAISVAISPPTPHPLPLPTLPLAFLLSSCCCTTCPKLVPRSPPATSTFMTSSDLSHTNFQSRLANKDALLGQRYLFLGEEGKGKGGVGCGGFGCGRPWAGMGVLLASCHMLTSQANT